MDKNDNLRKTNELKLVDKKPKQSYKGLFLSIFILIFAFAVIMALAFGVNVAKNGTI